MGILGEKFVSRGDSRMESLNNGTNLLLNRNLLCKLFDRVHHAIIIFQKEIDNGEIIFRVIAANSMVKKTLGIHESEIIGKTLFENFPRLQKRKEILYHSLMEVLQFDKELYYKSTRYYDQRIKKSYFNVKAFKLDENLVGVTVENVSKRRVAEISSKRYEKLLQAIAKAKQELLIAKNKIVGIQNAITVFGKELDLERVCILQVHPHPETKEEAISLRYEWAAEHIIPIIDDPDEQNMKVKELGAEPFLCEIRSGKIIHSSETIGNDKLQNKFKRKKLATHQIVPIFVQKELWGFFSIIDAYETDWSTINESGLLTLASGIGAAIMHHEEEQKRIESEMKFADLVANVPGVIYQWVEYKNGKQEFVYISPKIEEIFGIEEEKVKNDIDYFMNSIHPEDRKRLYESVKAAQKNLSPWHFRGRFIAPDGKVKWYEAIARPAKVNNGEIYFNGILLDITKQVEKEQEVKRYEQIIEGVALANTELIQADDYNYAINSALDIFAQHTKYHSILIFKCDKIVGEEKLTVKSWYENVLQKGDHNLIHKNRELTIDKREIIQALLRGEIIEVHVEDLMERVRILLKRINITTILLIPIFVHGEFWGTITIDNINNKDGWTHMERKALQSLASSIGGTIMRQMTEQDLITSRKEAIKANEAKSEFLAAMSHEIRTPMNAIIGMADLLIDTELTQAQRQYVDIFRKSGEALLSIINSILDLSKIESGQMILVNETFNLRRLIENSSDVFAISAQRKGLEFMYDLSTDLPTYVVGDSDRLRQILSNIVGNAIKFTEKGEVTIKASPYNGSRPGNILFSIEDTGIGIPQHKLEQIFDEFIQVDSSTTKQYGGTGLGLTISRKLVQMMNGEIWAESEVGKGTTFYFTITLKVEKGSTIKEMITTLPSLEGLKVLIVDDNSTNRLILKKMLEPLHVRINDVDNGYSAIDEIEKGMNENDPYELILLDGVMPDMNGIEVAKVIYDKWGLADVTIMMLTSDYTIKELNHLKSLGIHNYMIKPIKQEELYENILKAISYTQQKIDEKKKKAFLEMSSTLSKEPTQYSQNRNKSDTRTILVVDDSPDNRLLISAYLKKEKYVMDYATNGEEAVEKFKTKQYDIVLMDMQMPIMDGYTATRIIRLWEEEKKLKQTPIIALTAYALSEDVKKCLEAGCDLHVSKPIKKQKLLDVLNTF